MYCLFTGLCGSRQVLSVLVGLGPSFGIVYFTELCDSYRVLLGHPICAVCLLGYTALTMYCLFDLYRSRRPIFPYKRVLSSQLRRWRPCEGHADTVGLSSFYLELSVIHYLPLRC